MEADEAELARVGGGAGHQHPAGLEQGPEPLARCPRPSPQPPRARRPPPGGRPPPAAGSGRPRRRPAGPRPPPTGRAARRPPRPGRPRARPGTAPAAPGAPGRRASPRRRPARWARGRKATSATASARMPPTPSMTVMPNWGSSWSPAISSRVARSIGATSRWTSPSSGVAAASRAAAASRTCSAEPRLQADQAPLGLVGDAVAAQLDHDRVADGAAASTAASPSRTWCSAGNGTPKLPSSSLEAASERVGMAGQATAQRGPPRKNSATAWMRVSMASSAMGSRPSRPSRKWTSLK